MESVYSLESLQVSRGRVPAQVRTAWAAVNRVMGGMAGQLVKWKETGKVANNVPDGTVSRIQVELCMEFDGEAVVMVEVTHGTPRRIYRAVRVDVNSHLDLDVPPEPQKYDRKFSPYSARAGKSQEAFEAEESYPDPEEHPKYTGIKQRYEKTATGFMQK